MPVGGISLYCFSTTPLLSSTHLTVSTLTTELHFGALSRGPPTRCLRFVVTVTRVLPTTTQNSLLAGGIPLPDKINLISHRATTESFNQSYI